MLYQFVTARYENPEGSPVINLWARAETGEKVKYTITGFEPYFYVPDTPANLETLSGYLNAHTIKGYQQGFRGHDGTALIKVVTNTPSDVATLRDQFPGSREDDIRFIRRFLIDTGIKGVFEIPGSNHTPTLSYEKLIPKDHAPIPPVVMYLDIETYVRGRFPNPESAYEKVTCFTTWDTLTKKYYTVILDNETAVENKSNDWIIYRVTTEAQLLKKFLEIFHFVSPDLLTGWNIDFDITYLQTRSKKLKIPFNLDGCEIFGLDKMYDKTFRHMGNRLKDVVEAESYTSKPITPDPVESSDYANLYDEHRDQLLLKNKTHTQQLVEIDQKHKLTGFFWGLKNSAGLEDITNTLHESIMIDTLMLRIAHNKVVAPPTPAEIIREEYQGGLVMTPPKGILENIAVFDMSRFYPSIIIGYNLTPEKGVDPPLVPSVCLELIKERNKLDEALKNATGWEYDSLRLKRDTVKFLLNAVYGVFAYPGFRWYLIDIPKTVTEKAREAITFAYQRARELSQKYEHIKAPEYMDTDSLLMSCPFDFAKTLEEILNQALIEFCSLEKIPPIIKLKFEKYYRRIKFRSKKHYTAWMVWRDGKDVDEIIIKGMEAQRRDSSLITREVQKKVATAILRDGTDGLIDYLKAVRTEILSGKADLDRVAIRKTIQKEFDDYKTNVDFVRGSKWNNENIGENIVAGDYVKLLHLKSNPPGFKPTNVVCYLDKSKLPPAVINCIDWEKMYRKTVAEKIDELLEGTGISLDEIEGKAKLTTWLNSPTTNSSPATPKTPKGLGGWVNDTN